MGSKQEETEWDGSLFSKIELDSFLNDEFLNSPVQQYILKKGRGRFVDNFSGYQPEREELLWIEKCLALLGPLNGKTVLDIGAGNGAIAQILRDQGAIVTCLEPLQELGCEIEKRGLEWVSSYFMDWCTDRRFDIVLSFRSFQVSTVTESGSFPKDAIIKMQNLAKKYLLIVIPGSEKLEFMGSDDCKIRHKWKKPLWLWHFYIMLSLGENPDLFFLRRTEKEIFSKSDYPTPQEILATQKILRTKEERTWFVSKLEEQQDCWIFPRQIISPALLWRAHG